MKARRGRSIVTCVLYDTWCWLKPRCADLSEDLYVGAWEPPPQSLASPCLLCRLLGLSFSLYLRPPPPPRRTHPFRGVFSDPGGPPARGPCCSHSSGSFQHQLDPDRGHQYPCPASTVSASLTLRPPFLLCCTDVLQGLPTLFTYLLLNLLG